MALTDEPAFLPALADTGVRSRAVFQLPPGAVRRGENAVRVRWLAGGSARVRPAKVAELRLEVCYSGEGFISPFLRPKLPRFALRFLP